MSRSLSIDPITVDPEKMIERRELARPRVLVFYCPVDKGDDATLLRALADWLDADQECSCLLHLSFSWEEETDTWQLRATVDT